MPEYQFSWDLISPDVVKSLPQGLVMRPLAADDYDKGYVNCLSQLTVVGEVSKGMFYERFEFFKKRNDEFYIWVIEEPATQKIVGCGHVFIERKFAHQLGLVCHVEDIVVDKAQRGKNLGRYIVDQSVYMGRKLGCYKTILDCSEANKPFYEKCGFVHKEAHMALYHPENETHIKPKAKM